MNGDDIMNAKIQPKVFLNDKIAKKYYKLFYIRIINDVIDTDCEEVYSNITLSSEEIVLFSVLTINRAADSI